ncbi:hypothetical protein CO174_00445 [Candidatus Uhrbacteria bacterium CG_4_9_14_3_um_filter_50_9]|uniref:Fibronectin type-III domain-containing protein n=1 Tax=Candidatus Uhrbacteria bacterium CG_4_9_14_3_um_filter_50_9 TaxID=1975035 RepID=A0A2M7XEH2_9BACT|nr:MAG: hypothetical protein CO174_00445 [Candidatus Uhrbacteria bacterium CG_4_9_14_3_um_filter_50_9]
MKRMNYFWKGVMIFIGAIVVGSGLAWIYLSIFDRSTDSDASSVVTDTVGFWDADVHVSQVDVEGTAYRSSAKLSVTWMIPSQDVSHFFVVAKDEYSQETMSETIDASKDEAELTGLKSDTSYEITVLACLDEACETSLESTESVEGSTEAEYWQIQGTGSSYETAEQVVDHGSTLSYLLPYSDWAPKDLQGVVKYYFNGSAASPQAEVGIKVASSQDGYTSFDEITDLFWHECDRNRDPNNPRGNTVDPTSCPDGQLEMFAFQPIPLASGIIRLFFEASAPRDPDGITQIYSIDSLDGYVGEDFDQSSTSTICGDADEAALAPGGDCEPELLIGSSENGIESGIVNARQNKIGYPIQDSWIWDESPGTFMILTGEDSCGQTRDGLFYSVFDGEDWNVQEEDGCAVPLVLDAHGPVIVHMGGDRYKVYYENYEYASADRSVKNVSSKPTRLLYANGGDDGMVDLEDWEGEEVAREVHFLWPDGTVLDDQEESGLGDHMIWLPQNNLEEQVMYMNLGGFDNKNWIKPSAGLGMSVLVNP